MTPLAPTSWSGRSSSRARGRVSRSSRALVARIAAEAIGQPSPLPLLQYALSELFDRREGNVLTTEAYDAIGGLSGALASRAEAIFASSDAGKRVAMRRLFGAWSTRARARPTFAGVSLSLISLTTPMRRGCSASSAEARLVTLRPRRATREPTVEVAHEALLREWPRLVDWLREDAALLRSVDELSRASATWQAGGREASDLYRGGRLESAAGLSSDCRRAAASAGPRLRRSVADRRRRRAQHEDGRVKRLRRLVGVVGVALVLALIAGGLAVAAQRRADDQAEAATAAAAVAEDQTRLAESRGRGG